MTRTRWPVSIVTAAVLGTALSLQAAAQTTDSAIAGRLSCTTVEGDTEVQPGGTVTARQITCTYQPTTGQPSRFEGAIGRSGKSVPEGPVTVKRVYVWLVHGPSSLKPDDLSGVFTRTDPPRAPVRKGFEDALMSADGSIALMPPTGAEQLPGNAAVTILELTLSATRV